MQAAPQPSEQPPGGAAARAELSERDRRILAFEQGWWRHPGAKEEAIRAEFGLSSTRYYQILNRLIDTEAAMIADPMLVRRLRRLRDQRRAARSDRRDRSEE
ncbi:conserved hypothetical protein [Frankia canadensis]|uniref:DUF3263 domain-containing protein n=1 Tax=Frankia canadensis TaxID=1836972 RepID=A0A2I2L2E6_9ACTN|nr:DUF3263 domain-containing protein [Frankia canadensis]SNQ52075.1 conserved hypothetical protein [Frankia canadensis]SOU59365.1 conserved hypothetical protein [Frankia canadensis]